MEEVCKRWKNVSRLAWDDIKALNFTPNFPPKSDLYRLSLKYRNNQYIGKVIKKCGRYLHQLRLSPPCNHKILRLVGKHCHNLVKLDIELYNYGANWSKALSHLRSLECLEIRGIRLYFPGDLLFSLPRETLTAVHLWAHLPDVHFSNAVFLPRVAPTVFESLSKITALTLNGFYLKPNMMKVITQKVDLTFLSIANCSTRGEPVDLRNLTKLEHLDLTNVVETDNHCLLGIANSCVNLKHLNISKCITIDDVGMRHLLQLSHLEELILNDIFKITDAPLATMHNLRRLECENCDNVLENGIISLLNSAPNLGYLNLAETGIRERVLYEANKITKQRTNNLELHLVVSRCQNYWYANTEDDSPLLFIEENGEDFTTYSGSNFDDDVFDDVEYYDSDDFDIYNPSDSDMSHDHYAIDLL
ncbi:F-box/LRR-repeat protein fbxl-1-like isoform X2 [Diachasmimorpha longicaudata]